MSPHSHHRSSLPDIQWLEHRKGYPAETERQALIRRREVLLDELAPLLLEGKELDDPAGRKLVQKYGSEEVEQALKVFYAGGEKTSFVAEEAYDYRLYRHRYARFGGKRPYFPFHEYDALQDEKILHFIEKMESNSDHWKDSREKEIDDLLLLEWRLWEDITPLEVPARPPDFHPPEPSLYHEPLASILSWGTDLDIERIDNEAQDSKKWSGHIPDLERMMLDPGLLDGWPGEASSWAPWHALHLLGALESWQSIPAMATLSGRQDDWLSDLLPQVWETIGLAAEPVLWVLLEDRNAPTQWRGLAAEALILLAGDEPLLSGKVVQGFGLILERELPGDPTLNAYLINFTEELDESERIWSIIQAAFDEQRVDLDIITPEDLEAFQEEE